MLMDLFFQATSPHDANKQRVHFNAFMLQTFERFHALHSERLHSSGKVMPLSGNYVGGVERVVVGKVEELEEQKEAESWLQSEEKAKKSCGGGGGGGEASCGESWEGGSCKGSAELDAERKKGLERSALGGSGDAPTFVDLPQPKRVVAAKSRRSSQLLRDVANEMMGSRKIVLLCFDEFQLQDVVDATIIKGLFEELFQAGIVLVFTGNRPPAEINRSMLSQQDFEALMALISSRCDMLELDAGTDYRKLNLPAQGPPKADSRTERGLLACEDCYFHPLSPASLRQAEEVFQRLVGSSEVPRPRVVPVLMGRELTVPLAANGVAFVSFEYLCGSHFGVTDYLALASSFHTIVLVNVPQLSVTTRDLARRFILLIDQLYNAKVQLVMQAGSPAEVLFEGAGRLDMHEVAEGLEFERGDQRTSDAISSAKASLASSTSGLPPLEPTGPSQFTGEDEKFAFERAVSRLFEMRSPRYLQQTHQPQRLFTMT